MCRFVFTIQGSLQVSDGSKVLATLTADSYAYLPPNSTAWLVSQEGCGLVVFERKYALQVSS